LTTKSIIPIIMELNNKVAIVGIDCRYPGAHNTKEYWENILSLRQQFRRIPDKRLNLDYYGNPDTQAVDSTYSKNAAVLTDYQFDRNKYRISKSTFEQTDLAHWLALDVAAGALRDAGFENGDGLDKERVSVIIGNSLNGEFTRANIMRLRWPYVSKVLQQTMQGLQYDADQIGKLLASTEKLYKEPFPVPNADMLAGGLSNTIAGRICNYFDFNGGGYTVDGACSSSLLAVVNGCRAILSGESDVVIAGGVDLSIDAFEIIGFARNGALAATEMEVFSNKSQGFWPGEGCGVIIMMNAAEAVAKGMNIYAVINGWAISSDGKGGMTRPKIETQQLAMQRAYKMAGYDISSVGLFEAHGTGTPLGDEIEITAILNEINGSTTPRKQPAVLGSVKHLIGHTKAAAGVGGLIKACLAVKNKILPAAIKTSGINQMLEKNADQLRLLEKPMLWDRSEPFRAGVSSFGFGGINVHITVGEDNPTRRIKKEPAFVKKLAKSRRDYEVFPFSESNKESLRESLQKLRAIVRLVSRAEFTDLSAARVQDMTQGGKCRAAIVARTPEEMVEKMDVLLAAIEEGKTTLYEAEKGIFYNATGARTKNAFLFPGQGSPVYDTPGIFADLDVEFADLLPGKTKLTAGQVVDTGEAQPRIIEHTLHALELLTNFGVTAEYGIGHSLGEIAALTWAGAFDEATAVQIAKIRGEAMSKYGETDGAMLAVKCDIEVLNELMGDAAVSITGYNGKDSYVVGGKQGEIAKVQQAAFEAGITTTKLKVSHAFHTSLMRESATVFGKQIADYTFSPVKEKIISTVTGEELTKNTCLKTHLFDQVEKPVLFAHAIERISDKATFFFEVGPGTSLQKSLLGYENMPVMAMDFGTHSVQGFLKILAAAFTGGDAIEFRDLYADRFYREFDAETWSLNVLENPCETISNPEVILKAIEAGSVTTTDVVAEKTGEVVTTAEPAANDLGGITRFVKQLVSEKMDMPVDLLNDEDRIMSQLHINSLALTEIISIITKKFNKGHKVFSAASVLANADGTIAALCKLIYEGESGSRSEGSGAGVDLSKLYNWTHIFKRGNVVRPGSKIAIPKKESQVLVGGQAPYASELQQQLMDQTSPLGSLALYVYDSAKGKAQLNDFVKFLNSEEVHAKETIVLVQVNTGVVSGDLSPVFRSFSLENLAFTTFTLTVSGKLDNIVAHVVQEVKTTSKYREVAYDENRTRTESECSVYFPDTAGQAYPITESDVILATGGGKGITYESVVQLATSSRAALVIMGRSNPETDSGLSENLAKLDKSGIRYQYYSVDVVDEAGVAGAIAAAEASLGKITVILHGSGINKPKRLETLTPEDFEYTHAIKCKGLNNIIKSCTMEGMKLIIGYGSIIAESGMQGNADYAWANDQLALTIEQLSASYPHCRCITLEWSVWDETGMGVSLKSVDVLKGEGVYPISIKNGLQVLQAILMDKTADSGRYIITGRYGKIPTLVFHRSKPASGRFISKILHHIPGVEVAVDVPINLNDDVYLHHHKLDGQFIFPTVMILEGMAQAVNYLNQSPLDYTFEDLIIHKAVFVPKEGAHVLRFVATRLKQNRFKVVVLSESSVFENVFFEAVILQQQNHVEPMDTLPGENLTSLGLNIDTAFYDDLLFHTGPFRKIEQFYQIAALRSLAMTKANVGFEKWFSDFMIEDKLLGDPGLNDAAIHCHQACRPSQRLLPMQAKSIRFSRKEIEGPFFIKTIELGEVDNLTTIDVYVFNAKGEIRETWKGLVLASVNARVFDGNWTPVFLKPLLEYKLNKIENTDQFDISTEECARVIEELRGNQTLSVISVNGLQVSFGKVDAEDTLSDDMTCLDKVLLNIEGVAEKITLKIERINQNVPVK
jgi:enediyne polyketide synthase